MGIRQGFMLVVPLSAGLPCDARAEVGPWNSLRGLHPLRSLNHGQSDVDACCARPPQHSASQHQQGAPPNTHPALFSPRWWRGTAVIGVGPPAVSLLDKPKHDRCKRNPRWHATNCNRATPPAGRIRDSAVAGGATSGASRSAGRGGLPLAQQGVGEDCLSCRRTASSAAARRGRAPQSSPPQRGRPPP